MNNISDDYIYSSDLKYIETATCLEGYDHYKAKVHIGALMPLLDKSRARTTKTYINSSNIMNADKPLVNSYTSSNYVVLDTKSKKGYAGDTYNIAFVSGDINKPIII